MNRKIILILLFSMASADLRAEESVSNSIGITQWARDGQMPSLDLEIDSEEETALCDQAVVEKIPAWRLLLQQITSSVYVNYIHGKKYLREKVLIFLAWVKAKVE